VAGFCFVFDVSCLECLDSQVRSSRCAAVEQPWLGSQQLQTVMRAAACMPCLAWVRRLLLLASLPQGRAANH
jgi:hypothetical protein